MSPRTVLYLLSSVALSVTCAVSCGGANSGQAAAIPPDTAPSGQPAAQEEKDTGKLFCWQVTDKAKPDKVIYLLGSIHLGNEEMYPLDSTIEQAYARSDALVVEANLNLTDQQEIAALIKSSVTLPENQTIEQLVAPDTWRKFVGFLAEYNIPVNTFERFDLWFAAFVVTTLRYSQAGLRPDLGIDQYFINQQQQGALTLELESAKAQLDMLSGLPADVQELMLLDAIEGVFQPMDSKEMLDQLLDAWKKGDLQALERVVYSGLVEHPEFQPLYEQLLDNRNVKMAAKIETFIGNHDSLFVVVGAGHMVGQNGLVAIFERKGYSVLQFSRR